MEIILKQYMPNLGNKDEIVSVKTGYATNYLIPQGFATKATESAKKQLEEKLRQQAHKEDKFRQEAEQIVENLNGVTLTIGAKASSTGKIFGSVTNIHISEALNKKGFEIDKKKIFIEPVKVIGSYKAKISLFKDIHTEIDFEVVAE